MDARLRYGGRGGGVGEVGGEGSRACMVRGKLRGLGWLWLVDFLGDGINCHKMPLTPSRLLAASVDRTHRASEEPPRAT